LQRDQELQRFDVGEILIDRLPDFRSGGAFADAMETQDFFAAQVADRRLPGILVTALDKAGGGIPAGNPVVEVAVADQVARRVRRAVRRRILAQDGALAFPYGELLPGRRRQGGALLDDDPCLQVRNVYVVLARLLQE